VSDNSAPKVSIIIPALNEEKLLEQALEQFTPERRKRYGLEVVVSDGGSTDATLAIARRHDCVLVENSDGAKQTISLGRNVGARHASGDLLIFLNADTRIRDCEYFFQRMIELGSRKDIVAVTCSVGVYPEEEKLSDKLFHGFYNWLFALMNTVHMGMGRGECHVVRKEVFETVRGYAEKIAAGEDYDFFRRLTDSGRIVFLKDVVVFESPRRYRKYGYLYVSGSWFLNFLSVFFLRRSILDEWKPVR